MCDTVLKATGEQGEHLDHFLYRHLYPAGNRPPKLTTPTAQRLLGHVGGISLSGAVLDVLHNLQEEEPQTPINRLVAPLFRCTEDFKDTTRVRLKGPDGWGIFPAYVDEVLEIVCVKVDDTLTIHIDPRSPRLWDVTEYDMIASRSQPGSGGFSREADIATVAIKLSWYSSVPDIPRSHITGVLRQLQLMGK